MSKQLRMAIMVNMALILALVGSLGLQPASRVQAGYWFPHMIVTPHAGSNYYSTTAYVGQNLNFQTKIENDGIVALQIVAILTPPSGWDINSQTDDCPDYLAVGSACTLSWLFVPRVSGQALIRVYVRGFYTDSSGSTQRITESPAFLFNIITAGQAPTHVTGITPNTTGAAAPINYFPSVSVAPHVGSSYYSIATRVGSEITFEASVQNNGNEALQMLAYLTPPFKWEVIGQFNDCPPSLAARSVCTFTWKFIPRISGPTWVRVYVRGLYNIVYGYSDRVTNSSAFLFDVAP